jgi:hypothetical protein
MTPTTRLTFGADNETRELGIAQVAGHNAYRAGAPGDEAPSQGVWDVSKGPRGVEDALPRLRGDRSFTVEYFTCGLEADPGLRGDVA